MNTYMFNVQIEQCRNDLSYIIRVWIEHALAKMIRQRIRLIDQQLIYILSLTYVLFKKNYRRLYIGREVFMRKCNQKIYYCKKNAFLQMNISIHTNVKISCTMHYYSPYVVHISRKQPCRNFNRLSRSGLNLLIILLHYDIFQ